MAPSDEFPATRARVAAAAQRLAAAGLVAGTAGNVSARVGDAVAITPTGAALATVAADDVTIVALDGTVIDGPLAPTSELDLHLGVYAAHGAGAGAVVHTHAPVSTALSCVLDELPCVHYEMLLLGGPVRVAPYATFGTPALAASAVTALEGRTAALLANHGTIAFGGDLDGAVRATELLEWSATVYWRAAQVGTPKALDADERQAVVEAAIARRYGTTHRIEQHEDPAPRAGSEPPAGHERESNG
ncbi:MAG: class II aldolase/adducin family protein [Patulibacter sp.]